MMPASLMRRDAGARCIHINRLHQSRALASTYSDSLSPHHKVPILFLEPEVPNTLQLHCLASLSKANPFRVTSQPHSAAAKRLLRGCCNLSYLTLPEMIVLIVFFVFWPFNVLRYLTVLTQYASIGFIVISVATKDWGLMQIKALF